MSGEEGAALEPERPIEYVVDDLAEDIAYLAQLSQKAIASEIGMSECRWRGHRARKDGTTKICCRDHKAHSAPCSLPS